MSDHNDLFKFWLEQGWAKRRRENKHMAQHISEYRARVKHEVKIIRDKDFVDYFLIVSDIVRFAKDKGIAVGPGRGSSVGSLVCYLLRITEIDSMQFPVLFERFLDESRTDPPDIDVDFEDERRDEIFAYVATKYGEDCVANIGTYTRYKGKNSLDDVGRVYHIPNWKIESIKNKLLERAEGHPRFSKSLVDTYNSFSDISKLIEQTPELRYAARLEGNIRNFGVHAAGMVISSVSIENICATYEKRIGERQGRAIAFDKYDAAHLGLIKIDALSLSTLGMLAEVCRLAGMTLEELYRIPLDDKEILETFARGDVLGIFQFEGITTRRILKDVAPTTFMHLSDVNALARPGAQDVDYIRNKRKGGELHYLHPIMRQHLSWTYGVIVYEEQILMILRDLGSFAPKELNRMRKIIHDKLGGTAFNEYFNRFVSGAESKGLSSDSARIIWNSMVNASGYAFNVAHSVSYSHIAYWATWLKRNFTPQFYTGALLQIEKMSDAKERNVKRAKTIQEAELYKIDVLPPKLLESQPNWSILKDWYQGQAIIAGFNVIPGLGPTRIKKILDWRDIGRRFDSDWYPEWDEIQEIDGIGPKTVATIKDFCNDPDPFKVGHTQGVLTQVRNGCASGEFVGVPAPTHVSVDIPTNRQLVVFTGIIRKRKYYDAAEQLTKKEIDLSYDDALNRLEDKHLLKYAALYCEDEYGEQVRVSISRWAFPKHAYEIEHAVMDRDIIVVQGFSSDFQGISINSKKLWIMEP